MNDTAKKFMSWFMDKHLKYGDFFTDWWLTEGSDQFFSYAKKRAMTFMEIPEECGCVINVTNDSASKKYCFKHQPNTTI